eukprot:scaffold2869_cov69-Phaeocystis_antarctica.AAC.5
MCYVARTAEPRTPRSGGKAVRSTVERPERGITGRGGILKHSNTIRPARHKRGKSTVHRNPFGT